MRRIDIRPGFAAFVLLLAYVDLYGAFWPFFAAAALHELAHIVTIFACGGRVLQLRLGFCDAQICASPLPWRFEVICLLAGAGINLLCGVTLLRVRPVFASVSLVLAVFNLLPVWPLDGGRVLELLLRMRHGAQDVRRQCRVVGVMTCVGFALLGAYAACFWQTGWWVLLPVCVPMIRLLRSGGEKSVAFPHNYG